MLEIKKKSTKHTKRNLILLVPVLLVDVNQKYFQQDRWQSGNKVISKMEGLFFRSWDLTGQIKHNANKMDMQMGKASGVMRALQYSVAMKRELSKPFLSPFYYGHE